MKKLSSYLFVFAIGLGLIGCSQTQPQPMVNELLKQYQKSNDIDLVEVSYAIVEKLENDLKVPLSSEDPIIIASFVDVNNLNVSSTFGRIMAEQVGSRLAQKGYRIIELKLRQNSLFVEEGKGEFLLSRNLKDISSNHNASAVVVGTYASSYNRIYLSTRIINPSNSMILASCDYGVPVNSNVQASLLQN